MSVDLLPLRLGEGSSGFFPFWVTELEVGDKGVDVDPAVGVDCGLKIGASGESCLDAFSPKPKSKLGLVGATKVVPTAKSSSISFSPIILARFLIEVPGGGREAAWALGPWVSLSEDSGELELSFLLVGSWDFLFFLLLALLFAVLVILRNKIT